MLNWWNSLSLFSQVLACMAVPTTLILLIQTALMLFGFGDDGDGNADIGADISADADTDVPDGIFGDDGLDGDLDPSGIDGLRIFSLRGIIAFFVIFGWSGIALDSVGLNKVISFVTAVVCGLAAMVIIALAFNFISKLESSGNIDHRNALGTSGTVYLKIPPKREGQGKVNVMIQGSYCECDAVTDEDEALPTGSEITVVALSGQNTLVVRRK